MLNRGPEVGGSRGGGRGSGVGVGNGVGAVIAALGEVILRSLEGPFWREIRTAGGLWLLDKNPFEDLFGGGLIGRLGPNSIDKILA